MTLAKPLFHGSVYEVTLNDFRHHYRADPDLNSPYCIHRIVAEAATRFGFSYGNKGRMGFTLREQYPAQRDLHGNKIIQFDEIQRTQVSIEIEGLTTERYLSDWMVYSFSTVLLDDELISILDVRSTSQTDIRKTRFTSLTGLQEYLNQVQDHYAYTDSALSIEYPRAIDKYVPPDEPA